MEHRPSPARSSRAQHVGDATHGLQSVKLLTQLAFGKDRPLEEPVCSSRQRITATLALRARFWSRSRRRAVHSRHPSGALISSALDRLRQVAGEQGYGCSGICVVR